MELTKKEVSNFIPHDISFDILYKLPLKSLKRFTCVCKFWADLFEKPQFMNMFRNHYLSRSKYNDDDHHHHHNLRLLLFKQTPPLYDDDDNLFLLSDETTFENSVKLDWPPPFQNHEAISIIGSVVNGILCLVQADSVDNKIPQKVILWRPFTEEFKDIPSTRDTFENIILKAFPQRQSIVIREPYVGEIHGFGYDPMTDDYKLIRHFPFDDSNRIGPNYDTLWQIYSLKSNCWRDLQIKMPSNASKDATGYAVNFNGMCHWWGYEDYYGEVVLVSFNLSDEDFIKTPLLPSSYGETCSHLVVFKDSLAMIEDDSSFCCFISILGELGMAESWTRLFTIGILPGFQEPIGIGKNDDIFYITKNEEIARVNLNTGMVEEIGVKGRWGCCQMVVVYTGSLLPVGGILS